MTPNQGIPSAPGGAPGLPPTNGGVGSPPPGGGPGLPLPGGPGLVPPPPAGYPGGSILGQPNGRIGRILGGYPDLPPPTGPLPGLGPHTLPGAAGPTTLPPTGPAPVEVPPHPGVSLPGSPPLSPGRPDGPPTAAGAPPLAPSVPFGSGGAGSQDQAPPGGPTGQPPPTIPPQIDAPPPDPTAAPTTPPDSTPGSPPAAATPSNQTGPATPAGHHGVAVATGIFLAGGAVAAIVIAERHMRARQRRSYRPGSGRRDALPTPPAVRGMTRAHHTNPYRTHLDPFQHDTTAHSTAPTSTHTPHDTNSAAPRQLPRPVLPAGMRNNQPVHIDLGHGPIALLGPGAGDVARALIATTLSGVTDTTGPGQVIMSTTEADELLGPDHTTRALPTGITITTDLNTSLAAAAAARRRSTDTSGPRTVANEQPAAWPLNTGPVVLITNAMRPQQRADNHARVTELNATGVGVLVLGEHPEANTCEVNSEHIATAVHGPAVAHLDGTHLFNLAIDHIGDTFSPFTPHTRPTTSTHPGGDLTDAGESEPIHDAGHSDIHGDGPRSGLDAEDEYEQDLPGGTRPSETDPPDPTTRTTEHNPGRVAALLPAAWDGGLIREIGTRDGEPLHYDLGAFAGLGLTGPGASAALRALWIQLITPTPTPAGLDSTPAAAQVIIPIDAADALLGAPELETASDPSHATIEPATDEQEVLLLGWPGEVESLEVALDQLEVEIMTRTRGRLDPTTDPTSPTPAWAPIVLITRSPDDLERRDTHDDHAGRDAIEGPDTVVDAAAPPAAPVDRQAADWVARLRAVGERGAPVGIAVIVLGHWAYGTTCHVDETGQVSAPRGAGGFALRDATLAQLDTTSARAFFDDGYTTPPENPADPMPNVPDTADADPDAAEDHSDGDPGPEPQRGGTSSALDQEHANQDGRTANDDGPAEHDHGREGVGAEPLEVSANTEERESSARTSPVTEPIPASGPRPTLTPDLAGVPADALLVVLVLGPLAVFARSAPSSHCERSPGNSAPPNA
jgi:hypothetical protein